MDSLWGEFSIESIETPKSILEVQASYLAKLTKRKVYATIQNIEEGKLKGIGYLKKDFNYGFYLKSDFLNNYSYNLFTLHHGIELYPLSLAVERNLKEEIGVTVVLEGIETRPDSRNTFLISDSDKFKKIVAAILQSKTVRNIITSLVSLAQE